MYSDKDFYTIKKLELYTDDGQDIKLFNGHPKSNTH